MARHSLEDVIDTAQHRIIALARRHCRKASAFHFGAVDINPIHLAIWVTAPTDAERDVLQSAPGLEDLFRQALKEAGYPADAIPHVGFAYESQESVDREWNGNWWHRVK